MDKTLGHIIFNSTLSSRKIFFHSLIIFVLFFIVGLGVWHWYRSRGFLVVVVETLCYQIVDGM
jgi:hypothetical protein